MTRCLNASPAVVLSEAITSLSDCTKTPTHSTPLSLDDLISTNGVICPSCGAHDWTEASAMNLMFQTRIGAMGGSRTAFMRPETAQGMFMLYPSLYRHFRQRLPFGAMQTGKGYRNEISPRQGMIRLREFNMAELEYFIDPEDPPSIDLRVARKGSNGPGPRWRPPE